MSSLSFESMQKIKYKLAYLAMEASVSGREPSQGWASYRLYTIVYSLHGKKLHICLALLSTVVLISLFIRFLSVCNEQERSVSGTA